MAEFQSPLQCLRVDEHDVKAKGQPAFGEPACYMADGKGEADLATVEVKWEREEKKWRA